MEDRDVATVVLLGPRREQMVETWGERMPLVGSESTGLVDTWLGGTRWVAIRLVGIRVASIRVVAIRVVAIRVVSIRVVDIRLVSIRLGGTRWVDSRPAGIRMIAIRLVGTGLVGTRLVNTGRINTSLTNTSRTNPGLINTSLLSTAARLATSTSPSISNTLPAHVRAAAGCCTARVGRSVGTGSLRGTGARHVSERVQLPKN